MISFGPKKPYGANFKMVAQDYLVTPISELQGEASHTLHHHITRHDLTHLRIVVISVIFDQKGSSSLGPNKSYGVKSFTGLLQ